MCRVCRAEWVVEVIVISSRIQTKTYFLFFLQNVFTLTMNERFSLDGGYIGKLLFFSMPSSLFY